MTTQAHSTGSVQEKWIVGVIILVVLIIVGVSMSDQTPSETETGPIKIGVSAPLTGEAASFGEFVLAGAELAIKEINGTGGVNGRLLELIAEDDECSDAGVNAFNKLVNVDQVAAILGPVCSAAAGPGLPVAQEGRVPTIIVGASAPALTSVGDYIFRNYPSDSVQGVAAADFVYNNLGKRKVALLYVNNDWGVGLNEVFTREFENLGGEIVMSEGISQETTDVRTVLTKAKAAEPDALYIPLYPQTGVPALRQIGGLAIDVPVVAGDAFSSEEVLSAPEAEGVIFLQGRTLDPEKFLARATEVTGKNANFITPVAYDAVRILAQVMRDVGTDREAIRDALDKLTYTESVSSPAISFDENGDLENAEVDTRLITGGKSVEYTNTE